MTKDRFLCLLQDRLCALPQDEIEERLGFYNEAIEDRMEEGLSEEDAVFSMGTVDEIVAQIISDCGIILPKRHRKAWEIVLLVLGSPLWLSLLISVIAVVVAVYVSLWAVIVSLWAVFLSLSVCVAAGLLVGIYFLCAESIFSGVAVIAAAVICAGCAILLFFGCKVTTKGILLRTKKIYHKLKMQSKKEVVT